MRVCNLLCTAADGAPYDKKEGMSADKLLLSPDETCDIIGVRRSKLFDLLKRGEIPSIKIGRLRRIPAEGLRTYVERQLAAQGGGQEE